MFTFNRIIIILLFTVPNLRMKLKEAAGMRLQRLTQIQLKIQEAALAAATQVSHSFAKHDFDDISMDINVLRAANEIGITMLTKSQVNFTVKIFSKYNILQKVSFDSSEICCLFIYHKMIWLFSKIFREPGKLPQWLLE